MQTSYITVIIGISVPCLVLIAIVIRIFVMRRIGRPAANSYSQVQHNLDEEEIEFKRMFECQSDNIDDIFGEGGVTDSELAFDTKDMDRLNMLDKYRNTLISGSRPDENSDEQNTPLTISSQSDES